IGLLREADPELLGIRDAEDARATVARAVVVVEPELLVHRHLGAALPQRPRGRATHHTRTDDCDPPHAGISTGAARRPPSEPAPGLAQVDLTRRASEFASVRVRPARDRIV